MRELTEKEKFDNSVNEFYEKNAFARGVAIGVFATNFFYLLLWFLLSNKICG